MDLHTNAHRWIIYTVIQSYECLLNLTWHVRTSSSYEKKRREILSTKMFVHDPNIYTVFLFYVIKLAETSECAFTSQIRAAAFSHKGAGPDARPKCSDVLLSSVGPSLIGPWNAREFHCPNFERRTNIIVSWSVRFLLLLMRLPTIQASVQQLQFLMTNFSLTSLSFWLLCLL